MRRRSSRRTAPTSAPSTAPACGSATSSVPAVGPRVLEEPEVRDLISGLFEVRRQANTDTVAPYIAALSSVRLGLIPPRQVEEAMPDAPGIGRGFRPLPVGAGRTRSGRLRRADLPGHRDPRHRRRGQGGGPGPLPAAAGRRVPGPDPGPPAHDPAAGRTGLRLLRGGRRRPGHLRLLRGHPGVPDRLPALLPRCRPPPAGGQLPVPALGGRTRPATSSPTTTGASTRPSDGPRAGSTARRRRRARWPGRVRSPS